MLAVAAEVRHDVEVSSVLDPAFPGWQWQPDEIRRLAGRAADLVAEALIAASVDPVMRRPSRHRVDGWATASWLAAGASEDSLWDEVRAAIIPFPFGNGHPRFSAWVNSPPHPLAAMAAGVAAAMNPSVAGETMPRCILSTRSCGGSANFLAGPSQRGVSCYREPRRPH